MSAVVSYIRKILVLHTGVYKLMDVSAFLVLHAVPCFTSNRRRNLQSLSLRRHERLELQKYRTKAFTLASTQRSSSSNVRNHGFTPVAAGSERPLESASDDDVDELGSAGFSEVANTIAKVFDSVFELVFKPAQVAFGIFRMKWERIHGNFVLKPPKRAKAVIHFIGGAFVGAAPHIAYSTLLERLMRRGYCIVATPYDLSLDYLATIADITSKWEAIETDLALEYGSIPVIGVGHSAGALFHAIASSLFDDVSPKAANVLISYNNKPIKSAIPLYNSLIVPIAQQSVFLESVLPQSFREFVDGLPGNLDAAAESSVLTPRLYKEVVLPLSKDARRVVQQLGPLVKELGGKSRADGLAEERESSYQRVPNEFYPVPEDVRSAIRHMYRVDQTLVVKFSSDTIDESEVLFECLRQRQGEPGVTMMELGGNHVTPLVQEVSSNANDTEGSSPYGSYDFEFLGAVLSVTREIISGIGTKEISSLEALIDEWVESGIANGSI